MLIPVSPFNESPNLGLVLGTPNIEPINNSEVFLNILGNKLYTYHSFQFFI